MDYKELIARKSELEKELEDLTREVKNYQILELRKLYIGKWFKEEYDKNTYYTKITSLDQNDSPIGFGFAISESGIELLDDTYIDKNIAIEVSEKDVSDTVHNFIGKIFKNG